MQQKIIGRLFLIFVISIIAHISACKNDATLTVEWVYINETDSSISFYPPRTNFNLNPKSSYSETAITEADQNIDIHRVGAPLNVDVILYNNSLCDSFNGKSAAELGPANIDNYLVENRAITTFDAHSDEQ